MSLAYVCEKLFQASLLLVSGDSLPHRLIGAEQYLSRLKAEDFPEGDLRIRFVSLEQKLTEKEATSEHSAAKETIFSMSDEQLEDLAFGHRSIESLRGTKSKASNRSL